MKKISQFYKTFYKKGNVCTDTRTLKSGDIFIALAGDNFNGNEYVEKALDLDAIISVTDDPVLANKSNVYFVKDSLIFLQNLAAYHRKVSKFHVIGLTGTNGKTTTKELIKTVIAKKFSCKATKGNLNNHIGVPLTILSIPSETEYAVVEMGANHEGEIKRLCEIASPDSGLITNVGMAHLEGFGSFEGVIKAKYELYSYLIAKSAKIYLNGADKILRELIHSYKNKIIYNDLNSICSGEILESYPQLKINITYNNKYHFNLNSHFYGDYNLENILTAACIGVDLGISYQKINRAIEEYKPLNNRSQILQYGTTKIILDCYNANPTSMQQALLSFSKVKSENKLVILGSMKELGSHSQKEHQKIIDLVKRYNFTKSIFIGTEFKSFINKQFIFLSSFESLRKHFNPEELSDFTILVKGSRSNQLERITKLFEK